MSTVNALPDSVLVWRPGAFDDPPAPMCCLRGTRAGSRAVVYRSAVDQGIAGVVEFLTDSRPRAEGGWAAEGVLRRVELLPRAVLVEDPVLGVVFRNLQSRRGLPVAAAQRLGELLGPVAPASGASAHCDPVTSGSADSTRLSCASPEPGRM